MKRTDFYYDLPEELIAQTPIEPRDSARLLIMNKETGALSHTIFNKIGDYLKAGDLLVINNTKVIPARLFGYREGSVTKFEALLLRRTNFTDWECITRPAKKVKIGTVLKFSDEL
ncbi:MAG: S-adenosylmethionine:tRNA ribosyltransferase-isomerase, partial [Clostridia bacterium]